MIDLYCSERHFVSHALPVWLALPAEARGTAYLPKRIIDQIRILQRDGYTVEVGAIRRGMNPVLVASDQDERRLRRTRPDAPVVYLEHGAGQTYAADPRGVGHSSYSGGERKENVRLFLCPSEMVAERWRKRYPDTQAIVVGCPKLDRHLARPREPREPIVAVSFHPDYLDVAPECSGAWPYYDAILPELASRYRLLGHGHPRLYPHLIHRWRQFGVEHTDSFDQVLECASIYVADNSSTLPEAAACGLQVVFLNAPHYRRDVHHGGRFWEWPSVLGPACDTPEDLPAIIDRLLVEPWGSPQRETMLDEIYTYRDGSSSQRAAAAIMEALGD